MLRFLRLRVVVNGMQIFPLEKSKPIVVPLKINRAQIVISDGFHYTHPINVVCPKSGIYKLHVYCTMEDEQLIIGLLLLILFYSAGITSDILLIKLLSFAPLLTFLYLYYIKRRDYLKVKTV